MQLTASRQRWHSRRRFWPVWASFSLIVQDCPLSLPTTPPEQSLSATPSARKSELLSLEPSLISFRLRCSARLTQLDSFEVTKVGNGTGNGNPGPSSTP